MVVFGVGGGGEVLIGRYKFGLDSLIRIYY